MIDLERLRPPAVVWLNNLPRLPGVAGFAALELLGGANSTREWRVLSGFLSPFPILWPSEQSLARVMNEFTGYRLSHGPGMIDALIAVTAMENAEPLATFNTRHFSIVPGLMLVQPYIRA
ncbi:MAG: VapC toxin family PIN domain ribonuclease [Chloroflexi bacterium]|nr:VapC toxin family PIN domain ribonuclease [Chloroflexota bacterium]